MKKYLLFCLPLLFTAHSLPVGASPAVSATAMPSDASLIIPTEARIPAGETWKDLIQQARNLRQFAQTRLKEASPQQADQLYEQYAAVMNELLTHFNNIDIDFLENHFGYMDYDEKTDTYTPKPELAIRLQQLESLGLEYQHVGEGMARIDLTSDHYQRLFVPYVSAPYRDYALIRAAHDREYAVMDGGLLIGHEELGERIAAWEKYLNTYPDNKWKSYIECKIAFYRYAFLQGLDNSPLFDDNNKLNSEVAQAWKIFVQRYPDSPTADYIRQIQALRSKAGMEAKAAALLQAINHPLCE